MTTWAMERILFVLENGVGVRSTAELERPDIEERLIAFCVAIPRRSRRSSISGSGSGPSSGLAPGLDCSAIATHSRF